MHISRVFLEFWYGFLPSLRSLWKQSWFLPRRGLNVVIFAGFHGVCVIGNRIGRFSDLECASTGYLQYMLFICLQPASKLNQIIIACTLLSIVSFYTQLCVNNIEVTVNTCTCTQRTNQVGYSTSGQGFMAVSKQTLSSAYTLGLTLGKCTKWAVK